MKKEVLLATDGACKGNPGPGGYGTILIFNQYRKEFAEGFRLTTNNRMEMLAVIKGLEALKESCKVKVLSDSKYIVDKLKELYHNHVVEAEKRYHLHFNFKLPTDGEIKDSEFDATPMVLLIGQYSTGKVCRHTHLFGHLSFVDLQIINISITSFFFRQHL